MQPTLTFHCSKLVQVLVMNVCTLHLRYLDQVDDRVFIFAKLEIEPSGSAVTPNSTVGASYMVSKYQLKGIVGEKTMFFFCTD